MLKVIEVMAESDKSWEDAVQKSVKFTSKTVKNIRSVYVQDFSAKVEKDKLTSYRVTVKISFEVDR